jgi:C4-dicarboxylate transporter, DctQ subunit
MVKAEKSKLNPFFKALNGLTDLFASLTSAGIFIVVIWQVIGRLIGHPAPWTEELTRFIFIWMIYLGIGIGFRKAESARVTLFLNYFPSFIRKGSIWIYSIAVIGFFLFMFFSGIELMSQQITMNETSSVLLIPMWLIGLSVPFGAFVGILNTIQSLIYDRSLL